MPQLSTTAVPLQTKAQSNCSVVQQKPNLSSDRPSGQARSDTSTCAAILLRLEAIMKQLQSVEHINLERQRYDGPFCYVTYLSSGVLAQVPLHLFVSPSYCSSTTNTNINPTQVVFYLGCCLNMWYVCFQLDALTVKPVLPSIHWPHSLILAVPPHTLLQSTLENTENLH